ncbi:hypothetical protein C8Q76DRAFT_803454 [Earliella scabrosa]|nr:hypothetical protein C8Q76DRAFT_803454 [Earliella scabrosa]
MDNISSNHAHRDASSTITGFPAGSCQRTEEGTIEGHAVPNQLEEPESATSAVDNQEDRALSEMYEQTKQNILDLPRTISDTDRNFKKVQGLLPSANISFDYKAIWNAEEMQKLWQAYRTEFKRLVRESHDSAVHASALMNHVANMILVDIQPDGYEDVHRELGQFCKHFERPAKDFQKAQDEWDALQELLGEFKERVDSSLKPGIESVASNSDVILTIGIGVAAVGCLTITMCGGLVALKALSMATNTWIFRTAAANILRTAATAGVSVIVSVSGIGTAVHADNEYRSAQELRHVVCRHKAAARSSQTEHASRVASLETVMDDIAKIQSSIEAISEKLSVIIGITHYLETDIKGLQNNLQLILSLSPTHYNPRFQRKVANIRGLYSALSTLLRLYAQQPLKNVYGDGETSSNHANPTRSPSLQFTWV